MIRLALFLMILFATTAASAQVRLQLESPTGLSNLPLAPGGSVQFTFRVRNVGTQSGTANFIAEERRYNGSSFDEYEFTSLSAGCGSVSTSLSYGQMQLLLPIEDLAPNASRSCSYRIDRSVQSRNDLSLRLCNFQFGFQSCYHRHQLNVGTLPDTALSIERVGAFAPGSNQVLVRLSVRNLSNQAIAGRVATTECREFAGGFFDGTPFTIDSNFPGGCPSEPGEGCLNFTGQNFDAYGFQLGPISANGSNACLIRLTPVVGSNHNPRNGAFATDFYLRDDQVVLASNGLAFDPNPGNGQVVLGGGVTTAVPIWPGSLVVLVGLLLGLGSLAVRRRLG